MREQMHDKMMIEGNTDLNSDEITDCSTSNET